MRTLDVAAAIWLAVFNTATFLAFGLDKWKSSRSNGRIAESSLVMLGALGGWPAGLLAMNLFRHKTAKPTFKLKYAFALIPFALEVVAWQHWR